MTELKQDADLVEWTLLPTDNWQECDWCQETIPRGEHGLMGDDDRWLHEDCWEAHAGYLAAQKGADDD